MAMPNKKGWLAILFIVFCLAIPFGITYYVSTDGFKARYARWRGEPPGPMPEKAAVKVRRLGPDHRVLLTRGERIRVGRTSLVYKGGEAGQVVLDLYLEELDPDHAYVQTFPKSPGKEIRLGGVTYRVVSVTSRTLVLAILQRTETR